MPLWQTCLRAGLVVAATLIGTACSAQIEDPDEEVPVAELFGQGEAMVENLCVQCHAIGADDVSAHPDAPALRDLSKSLRLEDLREPLSRGIVVDHPDMPEWAFEPHHVDALLFYLEQLQDD